MKRKQQGFTLVEILVVITIITLLVALLVVLIANIIEKARYAKTAATVKLLDEGCRTYRVDFAEYPPNKLGDSRDLHKALGINRVLNAVQSDQGSALVTRKPPIIEFQRDMLEDTKGVPIDPKNNPVHIVDAFDNFIRYVKPGKYNKQGFDIWSPGKNGKDEYDPAASDYDDVSNWGKEY